MKEGRWARYGRARACQLNDIIRHRENPEEYKELFLKELSTYSFETKKKGEPPNSGCVWELKGAEGDDIEDPRYLAKSVKEELHGTYRKARAKIIMDTILKNLD